MSLVEHAGLVRRNHVLDVDVGVIASVALKHFQCLLDQVAQVLALPLTVVDPVATVHYATSRTAVKVEN